MEKVSVLSQLVKKAQKDPNAFAELYAQTFSFSYTVARRYLNNPQDIEDVLQTSYMYAANALSSLRDPENYKSWMQTIILHECQKCLRTNKKINDLALRSRETIEFENEQAEWIDYLEQNETYDVIHKIVESLPNEQKICAALFYYEERSVEEIAEILEVPQGTVKSRLFHVRKKVEKALRKLSKENGVLLGVTPLPILRSYFKHCESEVASASLRESVWSTILSPGSASRSARHFLRFGAAASGSGGFAASSGTAMTTAIKATAIAVSAVAVVGGSVAVQEHIRSAPSDPMRDTTTTLVYALDNTFDSTAIETTFASDLHSSQLTTIEVTQVPQTQAQLSEVSTQNDSSIHTQTSVQQTTSAVPTTAESSVFTKTTTVPKTTAPTTATATTTQPISTTSTTITTTQTTTITTTTTTQPTTTTTTRSTTITTTTAALSPYQMSGGVLRSYSGSESSVSIPSSIDGQTVTAIGYGAFESNQTLRSVSIPSTVTQIGQQAFSDCTSLQSVGMPSSLTSIGAGAFDGCTSLSSISVPIGTMSIGDDAFYGCTSLRSVTIPSSVQSIGDSAFDGCDGLTIRCAENSAAHRYAEAHDISYQLTGGI